MCCQCCSVNQRKAWVYGLGTVFVILGVVVLFVWPQWSESIVRKSLVLEKGSEAYKSWVEVPIPIYLKFYMFNWTNPHQVRDPHVKPHFVEMGPYVFLEKRLKENITFYNNETVFYYQRKTWFFQPQLSNGTLDDMVTTGHAVTAAVAKTMQDSNKFLKKIINFILNYEGGKLHDTQRVGDWIFNGYKDKLVDFLNHFNDSRIKIPYKKFGWMVDRNNSLTYEGSFTINTGAKDLTKLGLLTHWNNNSESGFYPLPCGTVNGTTGDIFAPNLHSEREITIFATDACRFMNLQSKGDTFKKYGLEALVWVGTEETLDSGANFPDQKCFCDAKLEECPKAGVVDCSKCRNSAPIYLSFPHFYLADKSYLTAVDGLTPNSQQHEFVLAVEPNTGIPMEIHGRLQLNLKLTSYKDFDIFRDVNEFLMPLFWFHQSAHLTPELANRAKFAVNLGSYGCYFAILLICLGGGFFVTGIVLTLTKKWQRTPSDDEVLLTN